VSNTAVLFAEQYYWAINLGEKLRMSRCNASVFVIVVILISLIVGCGGGGGGTGSTPPPADTTGPSITTEPVSKANGTAIDFIGGQMKIAANVADDSGVKAVIAIVTKPDSTKLPVTMSGSGAYSGTFDADLNLGDTGKEYKIVITATDDLNNVSTSNLTLTIPPPDTPPGPPG